MSNRAPEKPAAPPTLDDLRPPIRGLILDGDGVLWKDAEPIGDLPVAFAAIAARGMRVTIATNNAMQTVEQYQHKLRGFRVEVEPGQIVTSAQATADTLAAAFPGRGAVFLVGEKGIMEALQECGFEVITDPETDRAWTAVVAGIDRELSYAKLQKAALLARAGTPFYGTNPDATFPTPAGLVPGAGSILAAIAVASDREPILIGKPSPLLFQIAARHMELGPESLLVVGDRLETDIRGGQAFGARTALVLSGVSTAEQAASWKPSPTIISANLNDLVGV